MDGKQYEPTSSKNEVELKKEFYDSLLKSWKKGPDNWISKLKILRKILRDMKNEISDKDLMIHILNNHPEEYETSFKVLDRTIGDLNNLLTIETLLRDELTLKIQENQVKLGIC